MPAFYTFKRMERSLRFALNVPVEDARKFQARIKNLQHLGFTKGDRGEYTEEMAHRWLVALALALVIPKPKKIAAAVDEQWETVRKIVKRAVAEPDVVLWIECHGLPEGKPPLIFHHTPLWECYASTGFIMLPLSGRIQALHMALAARP